MVDMCGLKRYCNLYGAEKLRINSFVVDAALAKRVYEEC